MKPDIVQRQVRSWYGLDAEIIIESDYWHLVRAGSVWLPHPPLVNLPIRWGLPRPTRRWLGYQHEFGHVQTLPAILAYTVWLCRQAPGMQGRSLWWWLSWLARVLIVHQVAWEILAEGYVVATSRRHYCRVYRDHPNPLLLLFWAGLGWLAVLGTVNLRRSKSRLQVRDRMSVGDVRVGRG